MPESRYLRDAIERLDALLTDPTTVDVLSPDVHNVLHAERERLLDNFMHIVAHESAQRRVSQTV